MPNISRFLIFAGAAAILIGIIIWLLGNKLNWFGSLPGDMKIERRNFTLYAPFMSMLLLSIFLSLLIWVVQRFYK